MMDIKTVEEWASKSVRVHKTCVIEGDVQIGEGTEIGAFCYIKGPAIIGKNNKIYPHCIIGTDGEHKAHQANDPVYIGDNNTIRELTVIQRGTGDKPTTIGNGCFIMDHVHIAHDCFLENEVTIAPNAVLGGHTVVLEGANIGIGAATHQFSTIGAHAMVGMNSTVTKDVYPFALVMGSPAKMTRANTVKLSRMGIEEGLITFLSVDGKMSYVTTETNNNIIKPYVDQFNKHSRRATCLLESKDE
jgi:UDP-N-acetylglucosamine acyltransferase